METLCKLLDLDFFGEATPLQVACGNGCFETVSMLLGLGANIEFTGDQSYGTPALHLAAQGGHLEVVRLLLEHRADVGIRDWRGHTPLYTAVAESQCSVVKLLLEHHADIECRAVTLCTSSFYLACCRGDLDIVKLMIDSGRVHIDGCHRDLYSPLMAACAGGWTDVVKLLLDQGADINMRGPIVRALSRGHKETFDLLLNRGASFSDEHKISAFRSICWLGGPLDIFDFILSLNVPVDEADVNGCTPLHEACERGHKDIVQKLLPLSRSRDKRTNHGDTPLLLACYGWQKGSERTDIVQLLLAYNEVDVNKAGNFGYTPLGRACQFGDEKMVELLLSAGARPEGTGSEKYVTNACLSGKIEVAAMLISHGAVVNMSDLKGEQGLVVSRHSYTGLQCLFFALNHRFVLLHRMAWMTLCAKRALVKSANLGETPQRLNHKQSHHVLVALFQSELSWTTVQIILLKMPLERRDYLRWGLTKNLIL